MSNTLKVAGDLYTKPPLNALGGARLVYRKIALATTDLITTQLIALAVLPAGHRLVNAFLEVTDMDSSSGMTISVGILNTYYGEAAAGDVGVRLTQPTSAAQAAAAYSSGGATNTASAPALVSGQNLITSSGLGPTGGRVGLDNTTPLTPSYSIGVDKVLDRIVAVQFPVAPGGAVAGTLALGLTIDRDQE
jgi:hypothetical protein